MGNASSNDRERNKSGDSESSSNQTNNQSLVITVDKKKSSSSSGKFHTEDEENDEESKKNETGSQSSIDGVGKNTLLPTVFKWDGGGKEVAICGTFSDWKPIKMVRSHEDFVTILDLPEGEHQYKFCVDGDWKYDPQKTVVDSDVGTKNNTVSVKSSNFEEFELLDTESEHSNNEQGDSGFSQVIPLPPKPWENSATPPVLPPHLMQAILNQDIPLSCEPTLLPEPNHVMLNHLYALSIKDGVMVMSSTNRYRKKYVTTVYYKPVDEF